MKVFSAALALLASSSAPVFAAESTKLRAQQDDTAARDLAAGGVQGSPNASVDPFMELNGYYLGSSTASIIGRTLFGGCTKNLADCPAGGFYEVVVPPMSLTGVADCDARCKANTCSGAIIHFNVVGSMGNMANVDVTVTGGDSKNNPECQGGGSDALTIPYECMATARGGSIGFTCINRPIMFGPGGIPGDVLTVRATLTSGGNINWNAFGKNPGEGDFPPNAGELNPPKGTLLNTGSIKGTKIGGGDWGAMPAGAELTAAICNAP